MEQHTVQSNDNGQKQEKFEKEKNIPLCSLTLDEINESGKKFHVLLIVKDGTVFLNELKHIGKKARMLLFAVA